MIVRANMPASCATGSTVAADIMIDAIMMAGKITDSRMPGDKISVICDIV